MLVGQGLRLARSIEVKQTSGSGAERVTIKESGSSLSFTTCKLWDLEISFNSSDPPFPPYKMG